MFLTPKARGILPLSVAMVFACLTACSRPGGKESGGEQLDREKASDVHTELASANHYLAVRDLDRFRPGRSRTEILKDIQWRAGSISAAEYKGQSLCGIDYRLLADAADIHRGKGVHAIFLDDKFVKFINWLPSEMEEVDYKGTKWRRPKRRKLGEGSSTWLLRAMDAPAVSTDDLQRELKVITAPPEHTDIGLTIAWLLLRPGIRTASADDYKRNAALRDQFNAARLTIGMTEKELEAVLRAKPLESGQVEAGDYSIYGSNESFSIDPWLHFSNIVVVFREGRATRISTTLAGEDWRRKLGEAVIDLPK